MNKDSKDKAANEKRFQEISEAYEILEDDKKREMYDTYGHAGVDPNFQAAGGDPFSAFRQGGGFGGFGGGFGGGAQGFRVNMNGQQVSDGYYSTIASE